MKVLIAIVTCAAYRHRADAQRATWVKDVTGCDVRFFIGGGTAVHADEVVLPVGDGYKDLPAKTQAMFGWALDNGYTHIFKCDDDVYLRPERLLASGYQNHDYVGRLRGASGGYPAPYASGFGYWLSAKAAALVVAAPLDATEAAEDRFVGNVLCAAGVQCYADYRYVVVTSKRNARSGTEGPRRGNHYICACEYDNPKAMANVHRDWQRVYTGQKMQREHKGSLDRVAIMIKTFLRDGYLLKAIEGIERTMPDAKIVVVDDGYESRQKITKFAAMREAGHACVNLPFDSGFGAKANAAIPFCDRTYTLIGSDDFDFSLSHVRGDVERMVTVLDAVPELGMVSGRVDDRPYEGYIERGEDYIKEVPLPDDAEVLFANGVPYVPCDLTVNYSLIRSGILGMDKVHWHAEWKIGGDHYTFFDDVRKAGWKIAYIPGVNMVQMPYMRRWQHSSYPMYRGRARQSLPSFFKMQNIKRYIGFDGRVDTCSTT